MNTNIQSSLTKNEKEVINILRDASSKHAPNTTLRIVGGWVRDHIMGKPSNDIDVMVDNMSGEQFAKILTQYLNIHDPHVIKENPEKSKHIETAKAYIPLSSGDKQEIDFAQARKEVYQEDSRIPSTKPATAEEDAFRRDLTINSLFFNINTGEIEDFTGKGIKDLITHTIRTPEEPSKTFKDDPLRIFRVARFASKYNWAIDPETLNAMKDPSLRDEIKKKVSKERIGQEIKKMLSSPNSQYAIEILKNTGLLEDIIEESLKGSKYEGKMMPLDMSQNNPHHKLTLWAHTMEVLNNILKMYPETNEEKRVIIVLTALMHDLGKLFTETQQHQEDKTSYHGHEQESYEIAKLILKYLKLEPYIQQVSGLTQNHMRLHTLVQTEGTSMSAFRRFIRKMGEESLEWLDLFNLAVADAYSKDKTIDPAIISEYQNLEQNLKNAVDTLKPSGKKVTPVLNGYEIMEALGIKSGEWMKEVTEFVRELKDENPDITKEEAKEKVKEKFEHLSPPKPTKTASIEQSKYRTCPHNLLRSKINDIKNMIKQEEYQTAISTAKLLANDYGDDEKVSHLVAMTQFETILKNPLLKDNDIINYIFKKAQINFFDPILCAYSLGLQILYETNAEPKDILKSGEKLSKMYPKYLKIILKKLPENVHLKCVKNKLWEILEQENLKG